MAAARESRSNCSSLRYVFSAPRPGRSSSHSPSSSSLRPPSRFVIPANKTRPPSIIHDQLLTTLQICGDIHGQYYDLLRLFEYGGFPPEANYLFLGDYVDRGKQSLETICLLLAYKIKYPENFFVLRGNHECASINRIYGFYDECKRRYNIKLWKTFTDCFNCLPIAAIIDEKIFTMHGGLSPDLNSMEQIRRVMRPTDVSYGETLFLFSTFLSR